MKLPIHGHILYQVFKTYCSSIALFKYDFRTILWHSSRKTFNREGTSGVEEHIGIGWTSRQSYNIEILLTK
jgi:hypothetical protein